MPVPLLSEEDRAAVVGMFKELKEKHAEHAPKIQQIDAMLQRLDHIEEKQRQRPGVPEEGGRLIAELIGTKGLRDRPQSLARNQSIQFDIPTKAAVSALSRTIPYLTDVVAPGPTQELRLRSVIPIVTINQGSIVYTRETSFTNAAAPVAELAAKPESTLVYTNVNAPTETIAHYAQISRQCYEDLPSLARAIEDRLIYGLLLKEEDQLLNGDGLTPNLSGYMPLATAHAAFPAGTSLFDCLAATAGEQTAAGYPPTACVVNANDWTKQALAKTATEKVYIVPPSGLLPTTVISPAMPAGSWLVGQFTASALYQREGISVNVAYQHQDDFTHNRLTILAELREVLAIFQAAAFVKGTIPAPAMVL